MTLNDGIKSRGDYRMARYCVLAATVLLTIAGCPQNGLDLGGQTTPQSGLVAERTTPASTAADYSGIYSGNALHTVTDLTNHTQTTSSQFTTLTVGKNGIPLDSNGVEWQQGTVVYGDVGGTISRYTAAEVTASGSTVAVHYRVTGSHGSVPFSGLGSMTLKYSGDTVTEMDSFTISDGVDSGQIQFEGTFQR